MVRGSYNRPQDTYTATDRGKKHEEDSRREFGVPFIVDNRCKENILGFQPISERICTIKMETKFRKYSGVWVMW
jgi:hypothetical protein